MTIQSILLPVFVLVFMGFFFVGWMVRERMTGGMEAAKSKQISACLQNQFEMPPVFYVLVILAIITRKADLLFVVMEWLFVIFRIGHASIFATSNAIKQRGMAFMLAALTLFIMWVIFAIRILVAPTFAAL